MKPSSSNSEPASEWALRRRARARRRPRRGERSRVAPGDARRRGRARPRPRRRRDDGSRRCGDDRPGVPRRGLRHRRDRPGRGRQREPGRPARARAQRSAGGPGHRRPGASRCDESGHPGLRGDADRAAGARSAARRSARRRRLGRGDRPRPPRHLDGRANAAATRAPDHVRVQGGRVDRGARRGRRSPGGRPARAARRAARRRRWDARLARR